VPADERTLLNNLLDSLDRLYDRDCGPVDLGLLLTATASAVTDPAWIATIEQVSQRSGTSSDRGCPPKRNTAKPS
jgi:hypothetical protein